MSYLSGVGLTSFGAHPELDSLDLMTAAATAALVDAGVEREQVDGLVCGYSTVMPHLMLSTRFAEHFGLSPCYAHGVQVGGATGLAMVVVAELAVNARLAETVLVVAGENRLTGRSRDSTVRTLADVGHPVYEVPLGATVPTYYGLLASRYLHERGADETDLAELAVLMRAHASSGSGAHLRERITVTDVLESRVIASPLKVLDCCPISDGACAFVVTREPINEHSPLIAGVAQAHTHQHISEARDVLNSGAGLAASRALSHADLALADMEYLGIYDSFTVTLALLLEEIGVAPPGEVGPMARSGHFAADGPLPLNTHGGLLSYGHCGVAGGMAHLGEASRRMRSDDAESAPAAALVHADGGVLSSHVSVVLQAT